MCDLAVDCDTNSNKSLLRVLLSALEALCDYALYKSTFTLHYITLLILAMMPCVRADELAASGW